MHLFRHFCCRMYRLTTIHFVTDRQTDRQTIIYDANSLSYCMQQYDRLKSENLYADDSNYRHYQQI